MAKRTVELKLVVTYSFEETSERPSFEMCRDQLEDLVSLAYNRGLLTNDTPMVVDSYMHTVVELEDPDNL